MKNSQSFCWKTSHQAFGSLPSTSIRSVVGSVINNNIHCQQQPPTYSFNHFLPSSSSSAKFHFLSRTEGIYHSRCCLLPPQNLSPASWRQRQEEDKNLRRLIIIYLPFWNFFFTCTFRTPCDVKQHKSLAREARILLPGGAKSRQASSGGLFSRLADGWRRRKNVTKNLFPCFHQQKLLFFSHFHVLFTSPLASLLRLVFAIETNWFLIVFDPFTADKKFFDSEKEILEKTAEEKRFPLYVDDGCWREEPPQHCYVFMFSTWFFRWKQEEGNNKQKKASERKQPNHQKENWSLFNIEMVNGSGKKYRGWVIALCRNLLSRVNAEKGWRRNRRVKRSGNFCCW